MANISEFNRKPKVFVSYFVDDSGWDKQVTVNVTDVTHGSKLESMNTFWLRKDVSEEGVLREALDWGAMTTGIFEGNLLYSGPGTVTLHSLRNRPNVKLERVNNDLNESWPSLKKAVRNTLVG